jgi:hypothetical protein
LKTRGTQSSIYSTTQRTSTSSRYTEYSRAFICRQGACDCLCFSLLPRSHLTSLSPRCALLLLSQDIEKLGSKRGVVLQTIKDVLQSLVDDDLVHMEKIGGHFRGSLGSSSRQRCILFIHVFCPLFQSAGASNYFWSFPSEAAVKLETEVNKLESRLEERKKEKVALEEALIKSLMGKEDSVSVIMMCFLEVLGRHCADCPSPRFPAFQLTKMFLSDAPVLLLMVLLYRYSVGCRRSGCSCRPS